MSRIPDGAVRIAPGVYDADGTMHLALPELLEANGYEDNEANREALVRAAKQVLGSDAVEVNE